MNNIVINGIVNGSTVPAVLTTNQANAISKPVTGLVIYNNTEKCYMMYNESEFISEARYQEETERKELLEFIEENILTT